MSVMQYLNEKNYFLEKFCQLNETQYKLLSQGHVDGIDHFYNQRENLIKIVKNIDFKINQLMTDPAREELNPVEKESVKKSLVVKDQYVSLILSQDIDIIALLDSLKAKIFKELKSASTNKKVVSSYKSNFE